MTTGALPILKVLRSARRSAALALALSACGDDAPTTTADAALPSVSDDADASDHDAAEHDRDAGEGVDASEPETDSGRPADAATGSDEDDAGAVDAGGGGSDDDGGAGSDDDAATPCAHPLQCQPGYPVVPYPAENPASDTKAMLGKILFWEEQIGELDTMACGTCHRAGAGGSDPRAATEAARGAGPDGLLDSAPGLASDDIRGALGVPQCTSDGVITDPKRQITGRKPPTYLDAMFALEIFWDGRAGYCKNGEAAGGCFYDPDLPASAPPRIVGQIDPLAKRRVGGALEAQASGPPTSSVEMGCVGQNWTDIAQKLRTVTPLAKASAIPADMRAFIAAHDQSYPKMFEAVYGDTNKLDPDLDADDTINARRIVYAIATHERRLTSAETPWDRWNAGDASAMTAQQVLGFEVYMGKARCGTCHAPPLFTDLAFHYVGFHQPSVDPGRAAITGAFDDTGKVKTPTVRNAGLREAGGVLRSGDGSGHDLASMMRAYKQGGLRTDAEVVKFIDPALEVLDLTDVETDALLDFMRNALTDPRVAAESAPFDRPKLGSE